MSDGFVVLFLGRKINVAAFQKSCQISRERDFAVDLFAAAGVEKSETMTMQEEAGKLRGVGAAVAFVAKEGVADLGELAADLVLATAVQADLQEGGAGIAGQGAHVGTGVFQLPLGRNQALKGLFPAHLSLNQGEVGLLDLVVHEEFAEGAAGRLPFTEEEGTAGFKIETMYRGDGEAVAALLEEFLAAGGEIVGFVALTGVDRQPRRFGDDEEIAGFEKDLQGRHRPKLAQTFALGEKDNRSDREAFLRIKGNIADGNLPLAQELAQITRRRERDAMLQKHQKGEVLLPLAHGEGQESFFCCSHFDSCARR